MNGKELMDIVKLSGLKIKDLLETSGIPSSTYHTLKNKEQIDYETLKLLHKTPLSQYLPKLQELNSSTIEKDIDKNKDELYQTAMVLAMKVIDNNEKLSRSLDKLTDFIKLGVEAGAIVFNKDNKIEF